MKPLVITIEKEDGNNNIMISREFLTDTIEKAYEGGFEDGKREAYPNPIYPYVPAAPQPAYPYGPTVTYLAGKDAADGR